MTKLITKHKDGNGPLNLNRQSNTYTKPWGTDPVSQWVDKTLENTVHPMPEVTLPEVTVTPHSRERAYKDAMTEMWVKHYLNEGLMKTVVQPVFLGKISSLSKENQAKANEFNNKVLKQAEKEVQRYGTAANKERLRTIREKIKQGYYIDPSCINDATSGAHINNVSFRNDHERLGYTMIGDHVTNLNEMEDVLRPGQIIQVNDRATGKPHHAEMLRVGINGTTEPQETVFATTPKGDQAVMTIQNHGDTYKDLARNRDFGVKDFFSGIPVQASPNEDYTIYDYTGTKEELDQIRKDLQKDYEKTQEPNRKSLERYTKNYPSDYDLLHGNYQYTIAGWQPTKNHKGGKLICKKR